MLPVMLVVSSMVRRRVPFLALVDFLVGGQVRALSEPLETVRIGADVRLLPGVGSSMSAEIEIKGKSFVTDIAFVRFLACVDQLVALQFRIV